MSGKQCMMHTGRFFICAAAVLALVACSTSYSPSRLAPGTTEADAIQLLGPPTGQSTRDSGKRLEFARGPYGRHTFMVDFDAQGRMLRWEQVLTEENFAKIKPGMDKSEVLTLLGRPSDVRTYGLQEKRLGWSYRFESPLCDWFQIGLTLQGTVLDAAYHEDPLCGRRGRR
jgi:SmpA/OmlA family protein